MSTTLERSVKTAAPPLVPETRVILRRWKAAPRSVIALMPDIDAGRAGLCQSYMHVGQHGGADYALTLKATIAVDLRDQEVVDLLEELRCIGYVPRIILRYSRPA
jgi:hypothetical protein